MPQILMDDPSNLKIKDFVITDEFEILDTEAGLKEAIRKLIGMDRGVLLVTGEEREIRGVVTERKILKKIAGSEDPLSLKVEDLMDTHILKLSYQEALPTALETIEREKPAAVIVVNKEGDFKGYFSPVDFLQAEKMVKDFQHRQEERA